jgi:hypothetical protein
MPKKYLAAAAVFLVLPTVNRAFGAQLVTDESLKIEILRAAFPQAKVVESQQEPLDWTPFPWPDNDLTDALAGEKEYEASGPPDKFEQGWTTDMGDISDAKHEMRRVRLRAYRLSGTQDYVALAHYQFTGIQTHVPCCEWFARLFVLSRKGGGWTVHHTDASLIYRAKTIRSFRLLDLYGDGQDEVVVEAEKSEGTYKSRITMSIFRIANGQPVKIAGVDTLTTNNAVHTQFSRELDLEKTRHIAGRALYFKTIVYGSDDEQYAVPRVEEEVVKPLLR